MSKKSSFIKADKYENNLNINYDLYIVVFEYNCYF